MVENSLCSFKPLLAKHKQYYSSVHYLSRLLVQHFLYRRHRLTGITWPFSMEKTSICNLWEKSPMLCVFTLQTNADKANSADSSQNLFVPLSLYYFFSHKLLPKLFETFSLTVTYIHNSSSICICLQR